jgi:hypothetical protein
VNQKPGRRAQQRAHRRLALAAKLVFDSPSDSFSGVGRMTWFRHHYHCEACSGTWLTQAELVVEADCPICGERDVFPYKSDDWSIVVEEQNGLFVILQAMKAADRRGDYRKLKSFPTRAKAEAFLSGRMRKVG